MKDHFYQQSLTAEQLRALPAEQQRAVMETWFRSRYEPPDVRTPYDSEGGDYVWLWGGPHEPLDELQGEFGGIVDETVLEALATDLSSEWPDWAPVESEDDYDHALLDTVTSAADPFETFIEALATVSSLMDLAPAREVAAPLNRLLYANVITALETYLSDTFINRVLVDDAGVRRFIEGAPEYKKRQIAYGDAFKVVDNARDEAKAYLLDVVWHNLGKVQAMYKTTLGIDLRPHLAEVAVSIPTRHDIVHRNGRNKDGVMVEIRSEDVTKLVQSVKKFVDDIQLKLQPTAPDFPDLF